MAKPTLEPLAPEALRWRCDGSCIPFESTADAGALGGVRAQPTAQEALEFGVATRANGQNVFVRGLRGTGRRSMVRQTLRDAPPRTKARPDRCYVNNFSQPDRPRLLTLPQGQARSFRRSLQDFTRWIGEDFAKGLETETLTTERVAIQERVRGAVEALTEPLEVELRKAGMALVQVQQGPMTQTVILPLVDGEPVPIAEMKKRHREGAVSAERIEHFEANYPEYQQRLEKVGSELNSLQRQSTEEVRELYERHARDLLIAYLKPVKDRFTGTDVATFLREVEDDVIETRLANPNPAQVPDPERRYGVNIVFESRPGATASIIEENAPTLTNLLGTVEFRWSQAGPLPADYAGLHGGALLAADGGYLVLDAAEVIAEPGAWRALMRTLRTGKLEIVPPEMGWLRPQSLVNPEPIDVDVRVILIGDPGLYYQLDRLDSDFRDLFKVLADFDHELTRDDEGIAHYAAVIAHIVRGDELLPFDRDGLAAVTEHGARIASRRNKLTARFGRVADIVREAAFLARREDVAAVTRSHVVEAVARTKRRASLPSRKFMELIEQGTIEVATRGEVVGQINGLAVIGSGPVTYGFPARITATIGPGRAGLINIEGTASLSGSIHTKGFHILGGCLRHLLAAEHPLAFSASIAFEQSYGGIDGDSASGAEICCLLSALTGVPINQGFAMTGAIDQFGSLQAIGGVNEKVEGFYDACAFFGLTGEQGVIIPKSNAGDLMLRQDVVEACASGQFHVWSVDKVVDALSLLTATASEDVIAQAQAAASSFWKQTLASPKQLTQDLTDDEDESTTA